MYYPNLILLPLLADWVQGRSIGRVAEHTERLEARDISKTALVPDSM